MGDKNNENILSIRGMSKSFGRNRVLDVYKRQINGGVDEKSGEQVGPNYAPITAEYLDYDEVMAKYDKMMDWLVDIYGYTGICHYPLLRPIYCRIYLRGCHAYKHNRIVPSSQKSDVYKRQRNR